jgi:thiol-disulfide isomerase/thioredoxin
MYRLLILGLVPTLCLGFLALADEKKASAVAEDFKKLEAEFESKIEEVEPQDRMKLLADYAKKFHAHAEAHPKDATAFDALIYVLRMTRPSKDKDDVGVKAWESLKKDHLKNEKIEGWLDVFATRGDDGVAVLKTISEVHPNRKTQGKAIKAILSGREMIVRNAKMLQDNKDLREKITKARGEEFVKEILSKAESYAKENAELSKALEKYKDVIVDLSVGKAVPEVISKDLDDKEVKLSALKGKVVVIDIWATWCGPCRAMIPHTRKIVKKNEGKPFVFVSVSADSKKETLVEFLKTTPMPWTHWYNGPGKGIVKDWDIEVYPTIVVIDHKGIIRHKDLRDKDLEKVVDELVDIAEKEKAPAKD